MCGELGVGCIPAPPLPDYDPNVYDESVGDNNRINNPQAQVEYEYYKASCKEKLPPSGDECQDLRNQAQNRQMCAELRQQWDDKWWPGRHTLKY